MEVTVNTQPGQGTPKGWEHMGGRLHDLKAVRGHQPTPEEFGEGWRFDFQEVFYAAKAAACISSLRSTVRAGRSGDPTGARSSPIAAEPPAPTLTELCLPRMHQRTRTC